MKNILNKVNTLVTAITVVYTVTKFMFNTFRKYQNEYEERRTRREI